MKRVVAETDGTIVVHEAEPPQLRPNGVLTETLFSLINTGTEAWMIRSRLGGSEESPEILDYS